MITVNDAAMKQSPTPGPIPDVALDLAKAFKAAGWPLYLVGGWVRDALFGTVPPDLDFATPAPPDRRHRHRFRRCRCTRWR